MDFISKNNGYTNAYTSTENTNYQFQVAPTAFEKALDRFSDFFVEPAFNETYVAKELDNIESEYKKNIENNSVRTFRLMNILSNPDHPQSRVFQGNKHSLGKVPREVLVQFYQRYYSAGRMKLVIISPLSIQKLEPLVKRLFGKVKPTPAPINDRYHQPLYLSKDLPRVIEMKSIGDQDSVTLFFSVPPSLDHLYTKPYDELSSLLTRGGEGSFRRFLETRGWITDIYAGYSTDTEEEGTFMVTFALPKEQRDNWKKICSSLFGYLNFLKNQGLKKEYFEELQKKSELHYRFTSSSGGLNEASMLASQMHYRPALTIESEIALLGRYSRENFEELLQQLSPERVQLMRLRPDLKGNLHESEFQVEYTLAPLSTKLVSEWKTSKADESLTYPQPNPYLPQDLSLLGQPQKDPLLFKNDERQKLWIMTDHTFSLPKASLSFEIFSKLPRTPQASALFLLYARAVDKSHPQWRAQTSEAGLNSGLSSNEAGFSFSFSGYSDQISKFAMDYFSNLPTIDISEKEFQAIKDDEIRAIENEKFGDPFRIAYRRIYQLNEPQVFLSKDVLPELKKISLNDVREFAKAPFKKVFVRGYGFGSVTQKMVAQIADHIYTTFKLEPLSIEDRPKYERLRFPEGKAYQLWDEASGKNSAWLLSYQLGKTTPELAMELEIANQVLGIPFFNEMRTQRGFGYVATVLAFSDALTSNLGFLIQTDRPIQEVVGVAEDWIHHAVAQMSAVAPHDFHQIKSTLLETLRKNPSTFEEKAGEISTAVLAYSGDLDWKKKRIKALEKLTPQIVAKAIQKSLDPKNQSRVTFFVLGTEGDSKKYSKPSETEISDFWGFKSKQDRYFLDM